MTWRDWTNTFDRRMMIHRHNAFLGSVKIAIQAVQFLQSYPTTTELTRALARDIEPKLDELYKSLAKRRDQVGEPM